MEIDQAVITKLSKDPEKYEFKIVYDNNNYFLKNVHIVIYNTPVKRPTSRGGSYFVKEKEFKLSGEIGDLAFLKILPKLMLGPNSEFVKIPVVTNIEKNSIQKRCNLVTYLVSTMNNRSKIVLNMLILGTEFE